MVVCASCGDDLSRRDFAKHQLRKQFPRCYDCTQPGPQPPPPAYYYPPPAYYAPPPAYYYAPPPAYHYAPPPAYYAPPPTYSPAPPYYANYSAPSGRSNKRGRSDPRRDLIESLGLNEQDFDERFDFTYDGQNGVAVESRGAEGRTFYWPRGWRKLALSVEGVYESNHWLDKNDGWSVAFHGTVGDWRGIKDIVEHGFKVRGGKHAPRNGQLFGPGIYCTPDPEIAVTYAQMEAPLTTYEGDTYYVVFQLRVRPRSYNEHWHIQDQNYCWVVPDERDVRPCGILLRQA